MKVLFAVNNENISESIIKLYQREYKEIISGKNVYYFNAIVKELQRDQTYDRVVISEDLEPYTNSNFDLIDKFLFEQLDKISDEAISGNGSDIPIIFIATDRRSKSDNLLSKLFSIGVYDALLGTDRNVPEVCKLLNKPRSKKEAKSYYKIETDEVSYQAESEDSVSETEIQNILTHYKRLGKNTDRYVESFNNIAAQYNDAQLRIITKFLPINVKAVLEAESPKYQSIMTFGEGTYKKPEKEEKKHNLKIGFIETNSNKGIPSKPVVIPSAVNKNKPQKLSKKQESIDELKKIPESENPSIGQLEDDMFSDILNTEDIETEEIVQPIKKTRGRPKKQSVEIEEQDPILQPAKKGRGRPKKQQIEMEEQINFLDEDEEEQEEDTLPGFDDIEENTLPGFNEVDLEEENLPDENMEEEETEIEENDETEEPIEEVEEVEEELIEEDTGLPGLDEEIQEDENAEDEIFDLGGNSSFNKKSENQEIESVNEGKLNEDLTKLLTKNKKVVAFVGTTKAGTSFLINNVADLIAKSGISTAILDVTTNRNSYYIYTKNEENLRKKIDNCLECLEQNIVDGIEVSRNLTVFTSIPGKRIEINDVQAVIASLLRKYSLVLLDCDFDTPYDYFSIAQEIYLVQTMDILTIQPLTAFLRDLQTSNVLDTSKLKIIINKAMKVRGLSISAVIGGMSCYNDPEMSYMRKLFEKDKIPSLMIQFDEDVLSKYLSGMVDCLVTVNGYSKQFMSELRKLADMVYPLINNRHRVDYTKNNKFAKENNPEEEIKDSFTSDMNDTLDKMKKQYK